MSSKNYDDIYDHNKFNTTKPIVPSNSTTTSKMKCPFPFKHGYATKEARREYLDYFHQQEKEKEQGEAVNGCDDSFDSDEKQDDDNNKDKLPTDSLEANLDITQPLYFWQLHSLIGPRVIQDICTTFYDNVYDDPSNLWFKNVFDRTVPKRHHVLVQAAYWIDAMGGGKVYHGGSMRLSYHHYHNANDIMTARGAKLWMRYMRASIRHVYTRHEIMQTDPRIIPCIVSFLEAKMSSYADLHEWDFDRTDFILDDFYPSNAMKNDGDVNFAAAATTAVAGSNDDESKTHLESIDEEKKEVDEKEVDGKEETMNGMNPKRPSSFFSRLIKKASKR